MGNNEDSHPPPPPIIPHLRSRRVQGVRGQDDVEVVGGQQGAQGAPISRHEVHAATQFVPPSSPQVGHRRGCRQGVEHIPIVVLPCHCLLYTSDAADDYS
jgi:hypothetical protein